MRPQSVIDELHGLGRVRLPVNDTALEPAHPNAKATLDFFTQAPSTQKSYTSSEAALPGLMTEDTAGSSTSDGSLSSTQGFNSTNISSFSSVDDFADQSPQQAPLVGYTVKDLQDKREMSFPLTKARAEPPQEKAIPKIVDLQFLNALNTFGTTGLGASDVFSVEARPQSLTHSGRDPSIRVYQPTDLLCNSMPPWTFRRCSPADLSQMKEAADFFSAARSFPDAFTFYGGICMQAIIKKRSTQTVSSLIRAAIDVARTATSDSAYAFVDWIMKNHLSQEPDVVFADTAEACLLHLCLGISSAACGNIRQAAKNCRVGLQGYSKLRGYDDFPEQAQYTGLDVIMLINAKLLGDVTAAKTLQGALSPLDLSPGNVIIGLLCSLAVDLADDHFRNMLDSADAALWKEAPTSDDLAEFEKIVLFCYLWTRWQAGKPSQPMSTTSFQHSRPALLEEKTGIGPLETLSAVAALILEFDFDLDGMCGSASTQLSMERAIDIPASKSTLARRARTLCRTASRACPTSIFPAFLRVYATSAKSRGSLFSTEKYGALVHEFIHKFADSHLSVELWEGVGDDPRLSKRPGQNPLSPSVSPTMTSTPRSSWSGYSSFRLLHQRTKQNIPPVGSDELSSKSIDSQFATESSSCRRHLISLSSSLSSRSSSVSIMDADREDVFMQDDI